MASKLELYKSALRLLGSQRIDALTDAQERRYVIDDCYDEVLAECLEQGQWNFAMKSIEVESSTTITPTFGYAYAFQKPADFVRLGALSANERYQPPLADYEDEVGYWWADVDPIYVKHVSNATDYGNDLAAWPAKYTQYVYSSIAERVCMALTQSDSKLEEMIKRKKDALVSARAHDAMNQPAPTVGAGSWASARLGGSNNYRGRRYERG